MSKLLRTPLPVLAVLAISTAMPAAAQSQSDLIAPEAATGMQSAPLVVGKEAMVVAANPLAAEAGMTVLRLGGSAADAAVAVQAVLGLVEPQSSGLGGGAFALWFDGATGQLITYDARETAPGNAAPDLFLDDNGEPLPFFEAVVGGRSVGVPGVPLLLEILAEKHGELALSDSLAGAIELAEGGFTVSPRLARLLEDETGRLDIDPAASDYFFPGSKALVAGDELRNTAYADALRILAEHGAAPFYRGDLAAAIIDVVTSHPTNPGSLALSDFAEYEVVEREPVCVTYRDFDVCGMGPPSSGGIAVGQILGLVEPYDLRALGADDAKAWRLIGDATRLAFADRNRYLADPDFIDMPSGLLDGGYLAARAQLLQSEEALADGRILPGEPSSKRTENLIDGFSYEAPATTHFVIADAEGNVISMTSSIENAFGARVMASGYLLNNQLTDFSFVPESETGPVANRVEASKRPRSSMSPTIVLQDGQPVYALGSPGGATIIPYVAKTLIALIDWAMPMNEAIALPHLANIAGPYWLEAGSRAEDFAPALQALGYETEGRELNSGIHGIEFTAAGIEGAADPRREGVAIGD
ncbi:MAG: gamma-glutamyltransferase [Aliihoeflea sp.]